MENIKIKFSEDLAKKIFGNTENGLGFLIELNKKKTIQGLKTRTISRGVRSGTEVLDLTSQEVWKLVVNNWNYEICRDIVRNLFKKTKKYKSGKEADDAMELLISEWHKLGLGIVAWPFSQGEFDSFVQRVNSEAIIGLVKDDKVKQAAVKYRRIKEINTVRNDFIETLIFEKNENIIPTLNHRRGLDFFIDGVAYDQKVAKSPTDQFIRDSGNDWKNKAIGNPKKVGEYLYRNQDEGRFGSDPRLFVVYLDENVSIERIRELIDQTNLNQPLEVSFSYKHAVTGSKNYKTNCFVIMLYNNE